MARAANQGVLGDVLAAILERRERVGVNPATRTALGTMLLAAIEDNFPPERGLLRDALAASCLPPGMRMVARATRVAWLREWLLRGLEREHPGTWAGIACRKRCIDELLVAAMNAGIGAVVSLGAGLDTRAYRLGRPGVAYFEVDLPVNIARKRAWCERRFGAVPPEVQLVPVDFDHEDLGAALAAHGLRGDAPMFFIWEGVTQYLQEAGVRATFEFLARAPVGSRLVLSYVLRDFIRGADDHGLPGLYRRLVVQQRLWHFGWQPEEVAPFLAGYGWREVEQIGAPEFMARYVQPTGRALTVMAIERLVVAEKTG
jgi:methyltransferase (TIGR00027 family)